MFIELKSFQLPPGHAIRLEGTALDEKRYDLLWDIGRGVVWVIRKGAGETHVFSCEGARMTPRDPRAALVAAGYGAEPKAKKAG